MDRIENVELRQIARDFGTPTYIYSASGIRGAYRSLRDALKAAYPDSRIHYAVKANTNREILRLLRAEGAAADCASPGELFSARAAGFEGDDITYTGNYESSEDLAAAVAAGALLHLDGVESLERLKRLGRVPERLGFRVNPGLGRGAFEQINTGGERSKFGVPLDRVDEAYRGAQEAGVRRFGIHMMPGSCVLDPDHFGQAITALFEGVGPVLQKLGITLEWVDMGGGLGIPYAEDERPMDLSAFARGVASALNAAVSRYRLGAPRLICEPGRFLVGKSGWVLSTVVSIKDAGRRFVGLDAGMTTLLRPALYGARHRVSIVGKSGEPASRKVDLCGPICESTDFFERDLALPELVEGDLAVLHDAGAYGFAMSSAYNGRPRPAEVLVDGDRARLIRPRQRLEDLI